ncbi:putative Thermitase [Candidatus Zixiibacteriota bacterium]|nr:putative Thermitase [candidate division Zixibacteria bacterium]
MFKSKYLFIFLAILTMLSLLSPPSFGQKRPAGFKPDELVCKMQPGYSIDIINSEYGTQTKSHQLQTNCYLLLIMQGHDAESLATIIDARPEVVYCCPNYILSAPEPYQRSEPFLDVQYIGSVELQTAAVSLDLNTAHAISEGSNVRVAVIDCGVNYLHPQFLTMPGSVVSRWDYIDNDSVAMDEPGGSASGHGTFVAGIIELVAPQSDIFVYRVLDTAGMGDGYSIAEAILKAVDDSCRVINLSLGMIGVHDDLDDAIRYARDNEVLVVAAAGNDSTDSNLIFPFPASREYCLAVAAVDSINLKADFSNYGDKVDVCAPGTRIYAPFLDTSYAWWDGTSFSTAFVSGAAGLIRSIRPDLTLGGLDSLILDNADNIDTLNPDYAGLLGVGTINIVRALTAATQSLIRGDINVDQAVNILDISYLIEFLYRDGPEPLIYENADVNDNQVLNILDVAYLVNFLYKSGPAPK